MTQQESKTNRNQPVHRIRMGRIEAVLWKNHGDSSTWYNLSRSYKDANDEWKSADSFGADDLLLVAKVANEAHSWIIQKQQKGASNDVG
jgi:hypothetical protein